MPTLLAPLHPHLRQAFEPLVDSSKNQSDKPAQGWTLEPPPWHFGDIPLTSSSASFKGDASPDRKTHSDKRFRIKHSHWNHLCPVNGTRIWAYYHPFAHLLAFREGTREPSSPSFNDSSSSLDRSFSLSNYLKASPAKQHAHYVQHLTNTIQPFMDSPLLSSKCTPSHLVHFAFDLSDIDYPPDIYMHTPDLLGFQEKEFVVAWQQKVYQEFFTHLEWSLESSPHLVTDCMEFISKQYHASTKDVFYCLGIFVAIY
jgi:hypothetical protein